MTRFQECKFGRVALCIAVVEPAVIWCCALGIYAVHLAAPVWLVRSLRLVYATGILSLVLAIFGLRKDLRTNNAALALVLGIVNLVVCLIPIGE